MVMGSVLEREISFETSTGVVLEETGDEQKINDGSAIVPIENPQFDGYLGFLLARHAVIGPSKHVLTQVSHVRVNYAKGEPPILTDYNKVSLDRRG